MVDRPGWYRPTPSRVPTAVEIASAWEDAIAAQEEIARLHREHAKDIDSPDLSTDAAVKARTVLEDRRGELMDKANLKVRIAGNLMNQQLAASQRQSRALADLKRASDLRRSSGQG
jgi:hypothetical protein